MDENMDTSKDLRRLVAEHHAFYEVLPYYLVLMENPGQLPAKTRSIRAGFDVDIYGVNTNKEPALPGPDYALGYGELQKAAQEISHRISDSCSIEAISFPSKIVFGGVSHAEVEGMLRLRISHRRGLDQPAGPAEDQALKEVEDHLHQLGVVRR